MMCDDQKLGEQGSATPAPTGTNGGTNGRTYDSTNAIATACENTNRGAKDPYYGGRTAYAANLG